MPNEPLPLTTSQLSASYGPVPALVDVSINVNSGDIVTLIGANGAGKSTLIKSIAGLIRPISGSVYLFGEDVTRLSPDKRVGKGLSVVPEGRRLFTEMTLLENLEIGAYSRTDKQAVARDMERVFDLFPDLRDRLATRVGTFSGGQQQMIAVARALMSGPRVLLLDEPTIGLAPAIVDRIAELIGSIAKSGVHVVLVEQNAEVALNISDYAYILEHGHVVAEDSAEALARSPEVQSAYLGV